MPYDRDKAVAYAHEWAFKRNPRYLNFAGIGGDCTNFISQCLYAGGAPMSYTQTFGWYYRTPGDRAPAWTGVEYLYNFLIGNKKMGPYATSVKAPYIHPGDIIQLAFNPGRFTHSLLVVDVINPMLTLDHILTATHSNDSDNRPLSTYTFAAIRYLSIGATSS